MLEVVKRKLEQQILSRQVKGELTVDEFLTELYKLIDSGKVHPKARIIFMNEYYTQFMCSNCSILNEKQYRSTILKYEIDKDQSTKDTLRIFVKSRTATSGNH